MGKRLFLYPIDKASISEENNNYVRQLIAHFGSEFKIVNGSTEIGLLDAVAKFGKTDVYYFNWIENIPSKRYGFLQVVALVFLLLACKVMNKKVVWFIHNNIAHNRRHLRTKKFIVKLMANFADLILSHSNQITLRIPRKKLKVFHHPVEPYRPLTPMQPFHFDFIIWGGVYPYKGVLEFAEWVASHEYLKTKKILIAGKFSSDEYYRQTEAVKSANVTIINKFLTDEELADFFSRSNYVLFTYSSPSVLSSAALCKSLSYGKEIIAPNIGSFKELAEEGLLYTYNSFQDIEPLLKNLDQKITIRTDPANMIKYVKDTSWDAFSLFVFKQIKSLYTT